MVARGKPDPETFLLLAERLNVRPRDCFRRLTVGAVRDLLACAP